jgi:threonine/homoserine/homoserine lactone efflux protein
MVPASHVLAYAAIVAVLIAVPGPSVLFTISRALTVGRRAALLTVIGNEIGLCVQVGAVALGLGAVVERSAQVVTVIKYVGAAYLVYLGVQAIRHRRSMAEAIGAKVMPVRPLRAVRDGFVVGVANPKSIVFFVVTLPEFISTGPGHLPVSAQMLILGGLFPVIAFFLDSAWAAVAGTVRQWLVRSPRRLALIGGTGGLVMIGLGVSVAATGRKDLSTASGPRRLARGLRQELFASATHPGGRLPRNKRVQGDQRGGVTPLRC